MRQRSWPTKAWLRDPTAVMREHVRHVSWLPRKDLGHVELLPPSSVLGGVQGTAE